MNKTISFLRTTEGIATLTLAGVIALVIGLGYIETKQAQEEKAQWQSFAEENDCKIIAHTKGSSSLGVVSGVGMNGQFGTGTMVQSTRPTTTWRCANGVTYTR